MVNLGLICDCSGCHAWAGVYAYCYQDSDCRQETSYILANFWQGKLHHNVGLRN